jgi:thioredoxin 1
MANTIFETGLSEFEQSVLQRSYEQPVLIDLWAEWCPPCIALDPVLRNVVKEYEGNVALARIEVDEGDNMKIAGRYAVRGFPTVILFRNGEEMERFSSMRTPQFIRDFIDRHMDA